MCLRKIGPVGGQKCFFLFFFTGQESDFYKLLVQNLE
jgi:hypothetical protein